MRITRQSFLRTLGGLAALGAAQPFSRPLAAAQALGAGTRSTRIADVELFTFSIPRKAPGRNALLTITANAAVLVRLRTADGVTGLGEASPVTAVMSETQASDVAVGKALAAVVRGRNAFAIPQIVEAMDAFSPHNAGIKAAFEMALWDICGKIARQPVHRLLGTYRESFETDLTVHMETPGEMARLATEITAQGFKNVKVKLGQAPALDIERIRAIRQAVGPDVKLRIDANQAWSPSDAVIALTGLEKYGVQFCEQPVPYWDWEGMRFIRSKVGVPVMADEAVHSPHDVIEGIRRGAMDKINIKLMKAGGILPGLRIATIAEAANIECMIGCMSETRIGLSAAAHLVMSQRNILYADLDSYLLAAFDPIVGGMQIKGGVVHVPDTPGLGVEIDPSFLKTLQPV